MHATAQAKRHAGQLPAAAEEFLSLHYFTKRMIPTHIVESIWFPCCKRSQNLFCQNIIGTRPHSCKCCHSGAHASVICCCYFIDSTFWRPIPTHKVGFFGFPSCMQPQPSVMGHLTHQNFKWPSLSLTSLVDKMCLTNIWIWGLLYQLWNLKVHKLFVKDCNAYRRRCKVLDTRYGQKRETKWTG